VRHCRSVFRLQNPQLAGGGGCGLPAIQTLPRHSSSGGSFDSR
jgi:hypothetical protein